MNPHSLRQLTAACALSLAALTSSVVAQTYTYPAAPRVYNQPYPYSYYPRGTWAPQYYAPPRTYSSYYYGSPSRGGQQYYYGGNSNNYYGGNSNSHYWPTGRDVPMAKPWLSR